MWGLVFGSQDPWPFSALWPWKKQTHIRDMITEGFFFCVCVCVSLFMFPFPTFISKCHNQQQERNKTNTRQFLQYGTHPHAHTHTHCILPAPPPPFKAQDKRPAGQARHFPPVKSVKTCPKDDRMQESLLYSIMQR